MVEHGHNEIEWMPTRKDGWRGRYCFTPQGALVSKTCSLCRDLLSIDEFNKNSSKKYGLASACRVCSGKYNRIWAGRSTGQGKTIGADRYALRRESNRKRTEEEVDRDRKRLRPSGLKKCTGCQTTKSLDMYYTSRNYEDGLQYKCKDCTIEARDKKYREYWISNNIPLACYVCHGEYEHSDHVVPSSLGGPDSPENRLPMCGYHNISKNGAPLLTWLRGRHPEILHDTLDRVLSYGVSPWTHLDSVEEVRQVLTELRQYKSSVL